MSPFWKKAPGEEVGAPAAPAGVTLGASRLLADLLAGLPRRALPGTSPRVLVAGPPSGQTIETFHGVGCKVHVAGDEQPSKLAVDDRTIDLVLGFDLLDLLDKSDARRLVEEWVRVIRPAGGLYLLARREASIYPPPWRADVMPDASIRLTPMPGDQPAVFVRQNREIEDLLRPLQFRDIFLRRDGLREIVCRRT